MCQEWKNKILENYPELKEEEFKVGDWIWIKRYFIESPALIQIPKGYYENAFGFDHGGNWTSKYHFHEESIVGYTLNKATKEEVIGHLIAEGKKRFGEVIEHKTYFKTVNDRILFINNTLSRSWDYCEYLEAEDELKYLGLTLYRKGKWAEKTYNIITKSEAEQKLNELGVNVKIVD